MEPDGEVDLEHRGAEAGWQVCRGGFWLQTQFSE